ncbi:hypothetical protein BH20ACI3_BH20ACI3_29970 [soil metagenome]
MSTSNLPCLTCAATEVKVGWQTVQKSSRCPFWKLETPVPESQTAESRAPRSGLHGYYYARHRCSRRAGQLTLLPVLTLSAGATQPLLKDLNSLNLTADKGHYAAGS